MSPGVSFALMSMLCAGVLDVLFGRYINSRALGATYLATVGGFFLLGQIAVLFAVGVSFVWDSADAFRGIAAGIVLVIANALLIESLSRVHVSLGSTIYRLNTIAVVLFAAVFLGEAPTLNKLAGVALGIARIFALSAWRACRPRTIAWRGYCARHFGRAAACRIRCHVQARPLAGCRTVHVPDLR